MAGDGEAESWLADGGGGWSLDDERPPPGQRGAEMPPSSEPSARNVFLGSNSPNRGTIRRRKSLQEIKSRAILGLAGPGPEAEASASRAGDLVVEVIPLGRCEEEPGVAHCNPCRKAEIPTLDPA